MNRISQLMIVRLFFLSLLFCSTFLAIGQNLHGNDQIVHEILESKYNIVNQIEESNFEMATKSIKEIIKKYPKLNINCTKNDCINISILVLSEAVNTILKFSGNYAIAIDLVKTIKNETKEKDIINFANLKLAELEDKGIGDKEQVIDLYRSLPKFFIYDGFKKRQRSINQTLKRIDEIKSYPTESYSVIQNAKVKFGLQSKEFIILNSNTIVQSLYKERDLLYVNGSYGYWTKIKFDNDKIGWIFDTNLSSIKSPQFFPEFETQRFEWTMEGGSFKRVNSAPFNGIANPFLKRIIYNIKGSEVVFSDVNKDCVADIIAYSSSGLIAIDGVDLKVLWLFKCERGSIPLVLNDRIIIQFFQDTKEYLVSLYKDSGNLDWKKKIRNSEFSGVPPSPVADDCSIYVGRRENGVTAFDLSNGAIIWESLMGYPVASSLSLSDGTICFASRKKRTDNDHIFALNSKNGTLKWKYDLLSKSNTGYIQGLIINEGKVYFGGANEFFYCLNVLNGKLEWKTQVRATNKRFRSLKPSSYEQTVYYTTPENDLLAMDADKGNIKWKYNYSHALMGTPSIVKNQLYIRSIDSYIHAISLDTGFPIWKFKTGNYAYGGHYNVVLAEEHILIGSTDNNLYIIGNKTEN